MPKKKRSLKKRTLLRSAAQSFGGQAKSRKRGVGFYIGWICLGLGIALLTASAVLVAFNYIAPGSAKGYEIGSGNVRGVTLSQYIISVYTYAASIIALLTVVVIIVAGYRYMSAMGNPQYIAESKAMAMGAIAGLVLVIFSYLILSTLNPGTVSW